LHAGVTALTTVRVFDRDAGSLKMVTVVKDLSTIEGLPAPHPTDAPQIMQSTTLLRLTGPCGKKLVDGRNKSDHDDREGGTPEISYP
jgi:hypothetical protein